MNMSCFYTAFFSLYNEFYKRIKHSLSYIFLFIIDFFDDYISYSYNCRDIHWSRHLLDIKDFGRELRSRVRVPILQVKP